MLRAGTKKGYPVNSVESVLEVNLEDKFVWATGVSFHVLSDGLDYCFSSQRTCYSNLQRPETLCCCFFSCCAETLTGESPDCFTDGDRADVVVFFIEGEEASTCQ